MKAPRELRQLVRKWQKRLGLMQWDIELAVRDESRDDDAAIARCIKQPELRKAVIVFFQDSFDEDMEDTVIHELLHLHLATFRNEENTPAGDAEEHAVYAISRCLAKLATEVGE